MAQFDVLRNPDPGSAALAPYLVDLQADLLSHLSTRVVAPLIPPEDIVRAARLHPVFVVEGRELVLAPEDLAAVRRGELGPVVGSLADRRADIVNALDLLFTGI
jgi:toxin CcdB